MRSAFVWTAGAAIGVQALTFALLHGLEPGLGWKSSLITDYVATEHASVARVSLAAFGVSWLALGVLLLGVLGRGAGAWIVFVLMVGAGLSLIYSSTMSAGALDPRVSGGPVATQRLFGVARLGLFVSLVVASILLRGVTGWEGIAPTLIVVSVTILTLLVVTLAVLLNRGLAGLPQRLVFVLTYAWVGMVLWGASGRGPG